MCASQISYCRVFEVLLFLVIILSGHSQFRGVSSVLSHNTNYADCTPLSCS